jgi:hypothetical protein
MTDASISPEDVAAGYIARRDYGLGRGPKPQLAFSPLSVWEGWIGTAPETAWPVFEAIVRLRPADDDILEQLWYRLHTLLEHHWEGFHERAARLVQGNARLFRIVPAAGLTRVYYQPKYSSFADLANVWLQNKAHVSLAHTVEDLIRNEPQRALALALELIERAPLHGFTSYDVMSPLLDLLRLHGPAVVDHVEQKAQSSVLLRRVLWRMRPQQCDPPGPHDVSPPVWMRVVRAAKDTTDYTDDDPPGAKTPLPPDLEEVAEAWFAYEDTFWAWREVNDLVSRDIEDAWRLIGCLVDQAANDHALAAIGAGPLEDLINHYQGRVVERLEQRAARDLRFRQSLAGVWLSLREVPSDVAERLYWASGGELDILERLDEPWRNDGAERMDEDLHP